MQGQELTAEIALAPGTFALLQDTTKGGVRCYVGPTLINQTGQETPVHYRHGDRLFQECALREAIQNMPLAEEGDYLVLENPARDGRHPSTGDPKQDCPDLDMGSKVNIPGPTQFALWPSQHATLVPGHKLRSNQYVACRVYNEDAATENWTEATIRRAESADEDKKELAKEKFIAGQRLIIRGDQVSFFIPPTGIEVVPDDNKHYVREAVTLERLEYCILIDEDGNKRYERGPQVVFPEPTEKFHEESGRRKFRAIELNPIQGLHIKVIADYRDDTGEHKEGDELFLTGEDHPIYFPRPEHFLIKYGERGKTFATAVPPGEGRYVMNRLTGEIVTKQGPDMLLPDPRQEVIVKRILTERQTALWYPDNQQALDYNRSLASLAGEQSLGYVERSELEEASLRARSGEVKTAMSGFSRSATYTSPRTLTLDTKFEGVPQICPWTGYAIMVVDKSGNRRVEEGPTTILLEFDETLEILTLSTGKPKTTDDLLQTVYLRVRNNKISDIVRDVLTIDHVPLDIKLSFTVDFEGEPSKWFDIENYVKFLCDHVRSVLKGRIRKVSIKDFWINGADLIRNFVLGESSEGSKRPGMKFEQNGMRITDVEVLEITIRNDRIAELLQRAEENAVASHISIEEAERDLEKLIRNEEIKRSTLEAEYETETLETELEQKRIKDELDTDTAKENAKRETALASQEAVAEVEKVSDLTQTAGLAREKAANDQNLAYDTARAQLSQTNLKAETEAITTKFGAMQNGFHEAMLILGDKKALVDMVQAASVQKMVGGSSLVEILGNMIGDNGLSKRIQDIAERAGELVGVVE